MPATARCPARSWSIQPISPRCRFRAIRRGSCPACSCPAGHRTSCGARRRRRWAPCSTPATEQTTWSSPRAPIRNGCACAPDASPASAATSPASCSPPCASTPSSATASRDLPGPAATPGRRRAGAGRASRERPGRSRPTSGRVSAAPSPRGSTTPTALRAPPVGRTPAPSRQPPRPRARHRRAPGRASCLARACCTPSSRLAPAWWPVTWIRPPCPPISAAC